MVRYYISQLMADYFSHLSLVWKEMGGKMAEMTVNMLMSIFFNSSFGDHYSRMFKYNEYEFAIFYKL